MTFARRYRLDTLRRSLEHLTGAQLDVIEAATAAMVVSNLRPTNSPECDAPAPLITGAHRTEPAGRPGATLTATSAPIPVTARRCSTCGDVLLQGACSCTDTVEAARAAELVAHELDFEAVTTLAVAEAIRDLPDAGLADEIGGGACSVLVSGANDLRPGDRVEVVEAVGSRTGPRYAIGQFVGWERNERTSVREHLVEVHGVVRRFASVRRVG